MFNKFHISLLVISLILLCGIAVNAEESANGQAIPIQETEYNPITPDSRASCALTDFNGTPAWVDYCYTGTIVIQYFDPATCGSPTYPFEIQSLSFPLYSLDERPYPVPLTLIVYDASGLDGSCAGPGSVLCRFSFEADSLTFQHPNVGTVSFPEPCCVTGPFFIGLEFNGNQGSGKWPSILTDGNQALDTCDQFYWSSGSWHEWYDWFTIDNVGSVYWTVNGNTDGTCEPCDWEEGFAHKMHYPQLPDTLGWDVGSQQPIAMADDWECSETGWVKDIHWWGSYRDGIEDEPGYFINLYIFSDIPADQSPTGYSTPGELLWQYVLDEEDVIVITPLFSESFEGWYNITDSTAYTNNHQYYFKYDVCLQNSNPGLWFHQDSGTIYWLGIEYQTYSGASWGWKSSLDHWNDNAVYNTNFLANDWVEIYDPINPLQPIDFAFVITGDTAGPPTGACCFDDGSCAEMASTQCLQAGGFYLGDSTVCLGDNNSNGQDDACEGPATGACCFSSGACAVVDSVLCSNLLGTYQGAGTVCLGDNNGNNIDDACESGEPTGACCYQDGPCAELTATECSNQGGSYQGDGTTCEGDTNPANGIDDACEEGPFGACCFSNGSCNVLNEIECGNQGGTYLGDGTACLGDANTNGIDDACEQTECDCEPGNANGDATINIFDITYLITYLYITGPPPIPYELCSGDPNCDCVCNIFDVTYLITFLYREGPPPCTCEDWLTACGPPLRK